MADEGQFASQTLELPRLSGSSAFYGHIYCPFNRFASSLATMSFELDLENFVDGKTVNVDTAAAIDATGEFEMSENYTLEPNSVLSVIAAKLSELTVLQIKSDSLSALYIEVNFKDSSNNLGSRSSLSSLQHLRTGAGAVGHQLPERHSGQLRQAAGARLVQPRNKRPHDRRPEALAVLPRHRGRHRGRSAAHFPAHLLPGALAKQARGGSTAA